MPLGGGLLTAIHEMVVGRGALEGGPPMTPLVGGMKPMRAGGSRA